MRRIALAVKIVGALALALVGVAEWEHVQHTRDELAYLGEQVQAIKSAVDDLRARH